jgi:hypothetical protein
MNFHQDQEIMKICDKRFLKVHEVRWIEDERIFKVYNIDPTIKSNTNTIYVVPNDDIFFKLVNDIFIVNKLLLSIDYNNRLFPYNWFLNEYPDTYASNCLFFDDKLSSLNDLLFDPGFDFAKYILKKKISELV